MINPKDIVTRALPSRNERFLWLMVSAVTLAITGVNTLSALTDAERRGYEINPAYPWIYELTSAALIIVLFPAVSWFVRRLPIDTAGLKKAVLAHIGLSIAFSMVHVAGMVGLRKLIFALAFGREYRFFDVVWRDALYEYRKDVVTYLLFITTLYLVQAIVRRDKAIEAGGRQKESSKLALKSGGQTVWLDTSAFSHATAAGNYVEIFAGGQMHLVRMSLTELEKVLAGKAVPVVRIHRSHLVNGALVSSVTPKGDGDADLKLEGGMLLPVSRRYRDRLSALD